ncbi:MAG: GNAT family N-acetyltransferase [Pseudomonadales bacterium]|jgi:RimJ/RimL family protein N-acetyltransferase|nr:GNAT family N-acetyltransferase [Pseudomonadales bacterium]MDP6470442.1 GNAT family N-acetyltransferase [Pseudomonadales bacterium]MDP6827743.1 GNAT family N-acetyltransferase [Pseudomonadales bacterium]MDP6973386.1 GNAT family N-acetyltransferase [Pseudomonadales bacterium]|tara:strand:- start:54 stop:452 length:399 start_codon:yes stop_codon:yes gene_type:complete
MTAFPASLPQLESELVYLREFLERDVPAWFEHLGDRESAHLTGDPTPASIDVCFEWLNAHRQAVRDHTALRWAIVPRGSIHSVGSIGLMRVEEERVEIGAAIGRAHCSRGFATAAAVLMIDYAFRKLPVPHV